MTRTLRHASGVRGLFESERFLFGVTTIAAVALFITREGAFDLWWHLKAAQMILREASVPFRDPFSFTAYGRPWVYHSWLSGLVLFLFFRIGGVAALVLLRAVVMGASVMVMWLAARRRKVGAGLASVLAVASCFQLQSRALTRPFIFSFLFFAAFYLVIQQTFLTAQQRLDGHGDTERGEMWFLWGKGGRLLALAPLMLLWANMHAGFLSGMLLIGAFGVGELIGLAAASAGARFTQCLVRGPEGARFRALLVSGLFCAAASLITPYGPGALLYPFRLLSEVRLVRVVLEWQRTPWRADFLAFWMLLALSVLVLLRSVRTAARNGMLRDRVALYVSDVLMTGGFGLLAARSVRHVSWFLLVVAPVIGYHLRCGRRTAPSQEPGRVPGRLFYGYVACAFAAVLVFRHVGGVGEFGLGIEKKVLPVAACDYMEEKAVRGRFYNTYEWGGYLVMRFWPEQRVFIDGRCLVYGDEIIRQAMEVANGKEGWREILDRWGVNGLLLRYRKKGASQFFGSGEWHCVYWDDVAIVALREPLPERIQTFRLTNPAVFDDTLESAPIDSIVAELNRVMAMKGDSWTAFTFYARAMLRVWEERGDVEALKEALRAAEKATRIEGGRPETWRVLAECYRRNGSDQEADRALRKARSLE